MSDVSDAIDALNELQSRASRIDDTMAVIGFCSARDLGERVMAGFDVPPMDEETWIRETAEEILSDESDIKELHDCITILRERLTILRTLYGKNGA